jgi:hypothetical protein
MTDNNEIPNPKYEIGDVIEAIVHKNTKRGLVITTIAEAQYFPSTGWEYRTTEASGPIPEDTMKGWRILRRAESSWVPQRYTQEQIDFYRKEGYLP